MWIGEINFINQYHCAYIFSRRQYNLIYCIALITTYLFINRFVRGNATLVVPQKIVLTKTLLGIKTYNNKNTQTYSVLNLQSYYTQPGHKQTLNWLRFFFILEMFWPLFIQGQNVPIPYINLSGNNWKYWNFRTHSTRTDRRRQSLPRTRINKSLQTFCRAAILSKTWRPVGIRLSIGE